MASVGMLGLILVCIFGCGIAELSFRPFSISYYDLNEGSFSEAELEKELIRTGLVTINQIPRFQDLRKMVLGSAGVCASQSKAAKSTVLEDGSIVTTLAATTTINGQDSFGNHNTDACASFDASSTEFRSLVSNVSDVFVSQISSIFTPLSNQTFLKSKSRSYSTIQAIAEQSHKLEHFHSYFSTAENNSFKPTLDFHTDQGLLLAFIPALLVSSDGTNSDNSGKLYIKLLDGTVTLVDFGDSNVLAFMLGEGVNQVFNRKLPASRQLRAVEHAMHMPVHSAQQARIWYGRMYLPPADAISEEHGITYGKLRSLLIDAAVGRSDSTTAAKALSMGCSRQRRARQLQEEDCGEDTLFCWMTCMPIPEDSREDICAAKGQKLACVSQYNQLWREEDGFGDVNPMCTSATNWITNAPTMAPRPRNCEDGEQSRFADFLEAEKYTAKLVLVEKKAVFLFKVLGNEVEMKLAYNGRLGYISIGLAGPPGSHLPGMNGASVVMGLRTSNGGSSVGEYTLHEELSAFRWWNTTKPVSLSSSEIFTDGCRTSLTFRTKSIAGVSLNMAGNNNLVWALDPSNFEYLYHGYGNRGHIVADFSKNTARNTRKLANPDGTDAFEKTQSPTPEPKQICRDSLNRECVPDSSHTGRNRRLLFGGLSAIKPIITASAVSTNDDNSPTDDCYC